MVRDLNGTMRLCQNSCKLATIKQRTAEELFFFNFQTTFQPLFDTLHTFLNNILAKLVWGISFLNGSNESKWI